MADERAGTRDFNARKSLSWLELLRTFLIALDPFKLAVAAAGIFATAVGWWLISVIFYGAWSVPSSDVPVEPKALAEYESDVARYKLMTDLAGPNGRFKSMPWSEDRGANPILVTRSVVADGQSNRFGSVLQYVVNQIPVLVEPLMKFLRPISLLFDSKADFAVRLYLFLLLIWFLAVWAFFGGVITRMAIVQMAGKEGGGVRDAVKFVKARYLSYLTSPLVPVLLIFAVVLGCVVFGLIHLIPWFGDIFDGLLWWIPIGAGFVMALLLVGLVGYPLMYTTLSAEGSDTFDALSRSYNYVYESPWYYLWYSLVAIAYGIVLVFFVVFMSSLMVYLGKWGVSQTPFTQAANRSPEYLFIYTPTSFGWRELMLQDSPLAVHRVEPNQYPFVNPDVSKEYMASYSWASYAGAGMVGFWMTLFFMVMLGFSYSYFWTASSMIYLLMRRKVDEVDADEIYTEEEEFEKPVAGPKLSAPPPSSSTTIPVDAPTLRVPSSPPPPPPAAPLPPPAEALPPPAPETPPGAAGG